MQTRHIRIDAQRRRMLEGAVCAAAGAVLTPTPGSAAPKAAIAGERDIVLGQSAAFTGSSAAQAAAYRDGALAAFADVNADGGVHGRRIRLVSLDDGYQPDKLAANTERLLREHKAFALFGYMWTNTVRSAVPIAEKERVPLLAPYTGYEELYARHSPWVFTTRASFADELTQIVRHLRTIGYTRIGLLHYDSASGRELLADTRRRMAAVQLELAAVGTMQTGSTDPAEAVRVLAAAAPQATILGASGQDAVAYIRAYEAAQAGRTRYYARSLIGMETLMAGLGPLAAGISISQTAPNPFRSRAPVAVEYRRLLDRLHPMLKPSYIGLEGLIAAKVFIEALRRAGPQPTREAWVRGLEGLGRLDTGGYTLAFGPGRHHGSRYVDITLIGHGQRVVD